MSEWSEGVDETDDDAFTWHTSAVEGGGGGEGMSVPDKVTLLREVEMIENGMQQNAANNEEKVGGSSSGGTTGLLQSMLCSCCSIEAGRKYYAEASDVTVGNHLLQALAPPLFMNDENVRFLMGSSESVELYGPTWIVLTYVLVLIASGGVWRYFNMLDQSINLIWIATVLLFGYIIVSSLLICYLGKKISPSSASFPHALCISGYALTAFVPMSALSALPVPHLPWVLLALSAILSSIFLLRPRGGLSSIRTEELQDEGTNSITTNTYVAYFIVLWQLAFALAVKLLFFSSYAN
eukprot:472284_1